MSLRPEKHSVVIAGHRTSVSLEPEFWQALRAIAAGQNTSVTKLLEAIDETRGERNLSSAERVYVLRSLQER